MASRLRNLIARATGAGFFDPRGWVGTDRDWLHLSLRLRVFEDDINAKMAYLDAQRCIAAMGLVDSGQTVETRQQFAFDGINRFRAALMPWMRQNSRQNAEDPMDDLLDWYATFRPDLLDGALRRG